MRFSYQWLKKWVAVDLEVDEFARRLTGAGLEVDQVTPVAAPFDGVTVGEITHCEPHPDADKLKVCRINDGAQELQVVCGAPNAAPGIKIPFAHVGATLGGGLKIRKAKLRGVESFGMACSARELGLSEDHSGLLVLPADAPLGADFRSYLGLDDFSIELELTPNRADCLGVRGLARDVAASCQAEYTPLQVSPVKAGITDQLPVTLEDPDGCPKYAGRIIRGINPAARSPLWLVECLRRSGVRSISAVVDITNYVMLELGQPMHAFDLDTLRGGITVRRGRAGEKLVLLDEKEVDVGPDLLAICDDEGPVALAGIMGGLATGVSENTRNLFLESAWFEPALISGKARGLGLHTDASHRFERGVDPQGQVTAIERMTGLLLEITGGEAGPVSLAESAGKLPVPVSVCLRLSRLNMVLGFELNAEHVTRILSDLGMKFEISGETWQVTAPSNRFDISIEEDLIEEVARIHGYDKLPASLPGGELSLALLSEREVALTQVREVLCAAGYQEAINYSFVDRKLLNTFGMEEGALPLANPISADMDVMRTSLLPGLVSSLARNLRRQHERVRLFETGTAFVVDGELQEFNRLAGVCCGSAAPEQWGTPRRALDFYDIKRDIESLAALRGEGGQLEFAAAQLPWLHPGKSAHIVQGEAVIGWIGALHPAVQTTLDIRPAVYAFEVDLTALIKRELPNTKTFSRFPSVRRDLAILLPESVKYQQVEACVREIAGEFLTDLLLFDVFAGKNVETGYKSLAIGLILQDVSCTLTDEVVDPLILRVVAGLEARLNAQLRG